MLIISVNDIDVLTLKKMIKYYFNKSSFCTRNDYSDQWQVIELRDS